MDKPGRNDPCYCGSGKKYKQCHMAADLAAEQQQRVWADAARDLRLRLLDYANDEPLENAAGEAAGRYWNDLYTADTLHLMSPGESERFLDWFAFDYALPEGGRVVERYEAEHGVSLSEVQRELLARWTAAGPMRGYELTGYERQTLHLRDLVTDEAIDVFEPSGHGNAPLGAILLGRVVPVHDHLEFFTIPAYIPPEEIADLPDKLAEARGDSAADEFLRGQNVLFVHHALDQARRVGRPPVARLDPRHTPGGFRQRAQHRRERVRGPNAAGETVPHMAQTRRKAI